MADHAGNRAVQHQIVPRGGEDADGGDFCKLPHGVGVQPGAVDHGAGGVLPGGGLQQVAPRRPLHAEDGFVEAEVRAVGAGVFKGGDAQLPGVHRAGAGGEKAHGDALGEQRLHGERLPGAEQPETGHAVCLPLLIFAAQHRLRPGPEGRHQRAAAGKAHVQLRAQAVEFPVRPDAEPGLQRAGSGVQPGVDDAGVGFAYAGADVLPGFQHRDVEIPFRERPGGEAAQQPRADDGDVRVLHAQNRSRTVPGLDSA